MAMLIRARSRRAQGRDAAGRVGVRRFARRRRPSEPAYRAVTLGPGSDDWAVIGPDGEVVYRGYAMYAARMATTLARRA